MRWLAGVILSSAAAAAWAQDVHGGSDPLKCKRCSAAYDKAAAKVKADLPGASFPVKMIAGFLFLADGRHPEELALCVKNALAWDDKNDLSPYCANWYPALAGLFLAEYFKHDPADEIRQCLTALVDYFAKNQERTGGWFKWFEGAYKDRLDYPVKDLGILDATIYGFLWSAKAHGVKVPEETMRRANECLAAILTPRGISYGTGQRGGETTGARGGLCIQGLAFAGQQSHKIYGTYAELLPRLIPKMNQGHHVGAIHCLGVTLGCRTLGASAWSELTRAWVDKLIGMQGADGGVYVGDDADAGGEKGLLGGNTGSTAAFALLLRLQDPSAMKPTKKSNAAGTGSKSPFSRKEGK
jgi:hypothetical protein